MYSGPKRFHLRDLLIRCRLLAVTMVAFASVLGVTEGAEQSHSGVEFYHPVKVRAFGLQAAACLARRGGVLVADYGRFSVYRIERNALKELRAIPGIEELRDGDVIQLNTGPLDTSAITRAGPQALEKVRAGKQLHLLQFAGPIRPEWRHNLEQTGVKVISYIPNSTYLVYGSADQIKSLQQWSANRPEVRWEGDYLDDYKIHPKARTRDKAGKLREIGTSEFIVQLVADEENNAATLNLLERIKSGPTLRQWKLLNYLNIVLRVPPELLSQLAAQPEVISIQPWFTPEKNDERQDQIIAGNLSYDVPTAPGYLTWLASKGFSQSQFDASGFLVDISDSGVDNGTIQPGHFGLYTSSDTNLPSRIVYNRLVGTPHAGSTVQGCDGHGTLDAHIVGGFNDEASAYPHADTAGYHYGLGVCPFVKMGVSVIFDPYTFTDPNPVSLQSHAYQDGARISNNSWAGGGNDYDPVAQTYDAVVRDAQPNGADFPNDGNQEMVVVFAAGNAGPGAQSVRKPGTAKNVITVGASENVRSLAPAEGGNDSAGRDGCNLADAGSNSANDIAGFSGRGPCADGRSKPDLVAPGTHITGGVAQESPAPGADTLGNALACFDSSDVCALQGSGGAGNANNFFPLGQQFYTVSSGTSHATPAVSGAAALLRQYFINATSNPPSPAMTKAFLMNSARYLTGVGANDSLWSPSQGMGEVNLGTAFDGVARVLRDQKPADKFTASGQFRVITGKISDPSKPLRVTLAWTDAPGSTTGNAWNNDLDLVVQAGGQTYQGNVFNGAFSTPGGGPDSRNNVESVFLPAGLSGNFVVTVTAADINSDGVPNEAPELDQDFALVIYNGQEAPLPFVLPDTSALLLESCSPANGFVDAGETVTMSFGLRNVGNLQTTNLVATLLATAAIRSPSGPQTYGALSTNGETVARSFSFQASAGCGTLIQPSLRLQDGTNVLGTVSFAMRLGTATNVFTETFDSVTAPDLPLGWGTAALGSVSPWTTSTASVNSAPNAAYAADSAAAGVTELESPALFIKSAGAQLEFTHNYGFEAGYDGGVLEIKIGTNDYTDILAAGATFEAGPYDQTLTAGLGDTNNPLHGRLAWSGSSAGFVTTVVDLPASAAGQNVRLKWRCGSDSNNGAAGWFVDDIVVTDYQCCGDLTPARAAFLATPLLSGPPPVSVTFTDFSTGTISNRFWNFGNGLTTNTSATNFTIIYTNASTNTVVLTVDGPAGDSTLARTNYVAITNLAPVLVSNGLALLLESCTNGAIDSGEAVTLSFTVQNAGGGAATNVTGTLLATGGVSSPGGPQNYGTISSGTSASRAFSFTANASCGDSITATLLVEDAASNVWLVPFITTVGQAALQTESFDGVSIPSLPPGWTNHTAGAGSGWMTTNDAATSSPNAVFTSGADNIGTATLTSSLFAVPAHAVLTFHHAFGLESFSPGTGLDGGVLEISIDGGTFNDILDAGGTFISGGYNSTLDNSTGNPLGGRQAWSGDSSGFITTTIALPSTVWDKPARFRWICGSDESTASAGWHIDDVAVSGILCCSIPLAITAQPQKRAVWPGQNASFSVTASGSQPLTYQWRFFGTNLPGATASNVTVTAAQTSNAGPYDVVISNSAATLTSAPATLTILVQPLLTLAQVTSNREFDFILNGNAGFNYLIETTTNLSNWHTLGTLSNATGETTFLDTNIISTPFRAYRAQLLP